MATPRASSPGTIIMTKFNLNGIIKSNLFVGICSLVEGVNLVVSSLTASAIAIDRLFMVLRKTPGQAQEKVSVHLPQF